MKKFLSILLIVFLLFSISTVYATESPENTGSQESSEIPPLPSINIPDIPGLSDTSSILDNIEFESKDSAEDIMNAPLISENPITGVTKIVGNKVITSDDTTLENASIDGNLIIVSKNANLNNVTVDGDVAILTEFASITNMTVSNGATVILGQNLTLNGLSTPGNLYVCSENVSIKANAKALYVITKNLVVNQESQIKITYNLADFLNEDEDEVIEVKEENKIALIANSVLATAAKTLFVAGFIFLCTYEFVDKTKTDNNAKYIIFSALKGFGLTFLIPILSIILLITIYGAGVSIALLLLYILILWSSVPIVSIAIMNMFTKDSDEKGKKFAITLCVAVAIKLIEQVPVLGVFVSVLVGFMGLGIVVSSFKSKKENK